MNKGKYAYTVYKYTRTRTYYIINVNKYMRPCGLAVKSKKIN